MIYHFVVGDEAAKPLQQALSICPEMEGSVIALKDLLHLGPLKKEEHQSFNTLRTEWWQGVLANSKTNFELNDLQELLRVGNELNKSNSASIWFWLAPWPADICAYYWAMSYLQKYLGKVSVVGLANLPFLDENGKLFYPKNISELQPKELVKARKLARVMSPSEMELAVEVYESLVTANAGIRVLEGDKSVLNRPIDFYDADLLSLLTNSFQKASKVLSTAFSKFGLPTGDIFLAWRLQVMAVSGLIDSQGATTRPYKDWEVRLSGGENNEIQEAQNLPLSDAV